jgi:hypothetical protein
MDWKKVCLTAQLFAAARQCPMSMYEPNILMYGHNDPRHFLPSKLSILPNFNTEGSWYVRNTGFRGPPVYFPPVDNSEGLMETLEIAWKTERESTGPDDWKPVYLKSLGDLVGKAKAGSSRLT